MSNDEPKTTDDGLILQVSIIGDQIRAMESDIANRELVISSIRKERSKLVAKRHRLQKAAGLK